MLKKIPPLGKDGRRAQGSLCIIFATYCEPITISQKNLKVHTHTHTLNRMEMKNTDVKSHVMQ